MLLSVSTQRTLLAAMMMAGLLGSGCSLRPQPEPPPVEPGPEIEGDLLSAQPGGPSAMIGGSLSGAPGAAPAGAIVRAYDLDNTLAPVETVAADDGSFEMLLDMLDGDEVRIQAIHEGARSKPLDVMVSEASTTPTPAVRALADCLSVAPNAQLSLGVVASGTTVTRSVVIANGCASDVTVSSIAMRRPVAGLALEPDTAPPNTIASGASETVVIRFEAPTGSASEVEDILLIEVDAPARDRRPVTIFADVGP